MVPREQRLAPSSLRHALRTLGPVTLLLSVVLTGLLGLLAQSASADHTPVPAPALSGPASPDNSTAPQWTFTRPADTSSTGAPTVTDGATSTVTIEHDYTTQCLYSSAPATAADFTAATPSCGVAFSTTGYRYTGSVSGDGTYVLSVRTAETTTTTTSTVTTTNGTDSTSTSSTTSTAYSPVESASYTYDGTDPVVTVTRDTVSPGADTTPQWSYTVTDGGAAHCRLTGPGAGDVVHDGACSGSPFVSPQLTTSGTYTLTVSSADAAGNVGTATSTYVLDVTAPTITISGPTTGTSDTVAWTVTVSGADDASCSVSGSDNTSASCSATGGTVTATRNVDGSTTLTVTADDEHGNVATATATYTRSTAPAAPVVVAPASPSSATSSTWNFTTDSLTETVTCRLVHDGVELHDGACTAFASGSGSYTRTLTADGVYTLSVTAANSTSPTTATGSASYTLDTTAPAGPALTAVHSGTTGSASPLSWTWSALADHTTQCRLTVAGTVGSWTTCTSPFSVTPTSQGSYLLEVRYVDALLNEGTPSSASYLYDSVAPAAPSVTLVGSSPQQSGDATWTVPTPAAGDVLQCRLAGPGVDPATVAWQTCATTITRTLTGEGSHTLQVRYVDAAGNAGDSTDSVVVVDDSAPAAPTVTGPSGSTASSTLTWTITPAATDGGTSLECRLVKDGIVPATFTACASNYSVTDGIYRLEVRAIDAAGNRSSIVSSEQVTVDTTGPAAPVVALPVSSGRSKSATWTVAPAESNTTSDCRLHYTDLDGITTTAPWAPCTAYTFDLLSGDGRYALEVRTYDTLGNLGAATTGPAYTLDATPPATPTVTGSRTGTDNLTDITYTFTGEGTAVCRLHRDGVLVQTYENCHTTSPFAVTLPNTDGSYTLQVTFTDSFGNEGLPGTSEPYLLDLTAPSRPVVTGSKSETDNDRAITYTFSGEGSAVCRLYRDGVLVDTYMDCHLAAQPFAVTLPEVSGSYVLTVTFTDAVGNVGEPGSSAAYVLDVTPPATPVVTGSKTATDNERSITYGFSGEGTAVCRLYRDGVLVETFVDCHTSSPFPVTLPDVSGSYVLTVTFTDAVGNVGEPGTSGAYVLDVTPPTTPTVTGSRTATDNERAITYGFTGEGTAVCRLYRDGVLVDTFENCHTSSPFAVTLPDVSGSYVLTATFTDAVGNVGEPGSSQAYVLDVTAPTTATVTGSRTGTDNLTDITYAFTGEGSAVCRLYRDGVLVDTFANCHLAAQPFAVTLPDVSGSYVLTVTFTDAVGNDSLPGSSDPYVLDVTAPTTPGVTGSRTGTDNLIDITYAFSGEGTAVCRLYRDGVLVDTFVDCHLAAQPFAVTLPEVSGSYVLTVTYTDAVGNVGEPGSSAAYVLDVTPPATPTVTGSRTATDNERAITYTFSGEGTAVCRLYRDGVLVDTFENCHTSSPFAVTLPDVSGSYVLTVTYTDAVGNVGEPGSSQAYVLDVTAPTTPTVTGSRTATDNERAITYTFTGEGTAVCRLYRDGVLVDTFENCHTSSPFAVTLPDVSGSYVLTVTFTDAVGNDSLPGSSDAYLLDVTAPGPATVTVSPATDNVESATWTVTPPESDTTTQCRLLLDGTVVLDWTACAAPYTYALEDGDGAYVLEVRVIDAVGNVGPATVGESYTLDTTPPVVPVVTSDRTVKDNERTITYDFSGEGTATCTLLRDGVAVSDPVTCTSPYSLVLPDVSGSYVLLVTFTDAVGNESAAGSSPAYELDVTPPTSPAVSSDRTGTDNERTVTYTFSGEGTATCQLTRNGAVVGDAVPCSSPWVVTLPAEDGSYVLLVTYTDAVGNASAPGSSTPYLLDLTAPPAPSVDGPGETANVRTVTWTYAGEGTATCTLLLGGVAQGAPFSCGATSHTTTLPADGSWSLRVTFTDSVGNEGPAGTSPTYLLDTAPPAAPGATGPTGPAKARTVGWALTAEPGTTLECRLVRSGVIVSDWTACQGSYTADLTGMPDGGYQLEVRATDLAGNVGPVTASAPYVLDTTAPLAPEVTGPTGTSQNTRPSFTWTGEAGAQAQCQLSRDGAVEGDWVDCSSGFAPVLTQDGTWTLSVRLVDAAGNVGVAASSAGYVLDTTAPNAPSVTPPKTPGRDTAPSWGVIAESGATLECRLILTDGVEGAWGPCSLPLVTPLTGRPDGSYVLEVRATDVALNVSTVGRGTYVLDTAAPVAAVVVSPASPGRSRTPTFTFTTEPGATTRCRLTSGTTVVNDYTPCTSPVSLDLTGLPDGTYTLTVRVADAAGNPGPSATGTYVLDTTAPAAPVFTLTPATPSSARSVTWAFSAEPGGTLVCRLTFPTGAVREISGCTSPLTVDLTGLPDGSYTLSVRVVDAAGNVGLAATATHVIDSTALAAPDVTGPVTPGSTRTPTWRISGTGTTECRLARGTTVLRDWAVCSGTFTADLFGQPDGTYTLSVRSRDASGAVSAATVSRYVLDTTAPAPATVVAPPTPSTNAMPTWTIASPELGATAECRVLLFDSVLTDWAPCGVSVAGSPHTVDLTGRGDGIYTLVVRLTDAAGNRGTTVATSPYQLDTSAPVGVGVTGPPSPGSDTTPTWLLSTAGGAALECRLTSGDIVVSDWATCADAYTADLTDLPDGPYTLSVRAVSEAGTPGPETAVVYDLNTTAPNAPGALTGPASPQSIRNPSWTFTLPPGATAVCRVVQGTRVVFDGPCTSPFVLDLSNAPDGVYTLTVRAVDRAGNLSEPATSSYELDTVPTAPPVLTSTPGATGSTLDPQWRFTTTRDAKAQCRLLLDGRVLEDWAACTSPYTALLAGRPDGTYTVQIRAVDSAGNTSPPVESRYVLDRTGLPVVSFSDTPVTPGVDRTVSWTFSAPEGTTLECRLLYPGGKTGWAPCVGVTSALRTTSSLAVSTSGTYRLDLAGRPDGDYVLEVRVVDAEGLRGSAATATYRLDTTPPAAQVFSDLLPGDAGTSATATWLWEPSNEDLVQCRLLRNGVQLRAWAECESPYVVDLSREGQGVYTLEIRLVDQAGNVGPATGRSYHYDLTKPLAPVFTSRPPAGGSDRTVVWTFTVADGDTASCQVSRDRTVVREGPCSGRYVMDLSGLPDGVYTLTVRYTDAAGNVSNPTTGSYALSTRTATGGRIDPPARPDPVSPGAPVGPSGPGSAPVPGPGRGGTGPAASAPLGSIPRPNVPTLPGEDDLVRSSSGGPVPASPAAGQGVAAPVRDQEEGVVVRRELGDVALGEVPNVLGNVVTETIKRPTLPLALLAIVLLFLLAQNRIDRRDPKLAAAPVDAEPELDFTLVVRRPGGALS